MHATTATGACEPKSPVMGAAAALACETPARVRRSAASRISTETGCWEASEPL